MPANLYRTGNLLPLTVLDQVLTRPNPGYASVYLFKSEDAKRIRATGSSRGLGDLEVAASAVTLDIDNPNDIDAVTSKLDSLGLGYEVWDSGRGFHVVLPHEFISDARLPYSHKCWVEQLSLPADYSLYQHARILRLPNTLNAKTGRRKQLIRSVEGMQPDIKLVERPKFNFQPNGGLTSISSALNQLQRLAISEPLPGNRHTQLWSAARSASQAGLSFSATLEVLNEINKSWKNQKEACEVELAVTQAYAQTAKLEQE